MKCELGCLSLNVFGRPASSNDIFISKDGYGGLGGGVELDLAPAGTMNEIGSPVGTRPRSVRYARRASVLNRMTRRELPRTG